MNTPKERAWACGCFDLIGHADPRIEELEFWGWAPGPRVGVFERGPDHLLTAALSLFADGRLPDPIEYDDGPDPEPFF